MKKIALILTLLLLFSGFSLAEGIEVSGLSDEELLVLQKNVTEELYSRGIDHQNLIYQGVYVVGKDIKAGTYVATSVGDDDFDYAIYDTLSDYEVLSAYKNRFGYGMSLPCVRVRPGESSRIVLEDGNVFHALYEGEVAKLEIQSADWMP